MKKERLNGILSALRQEDCVIFVGSGISMWSGLPSWTGLLNELADYIEECGEDNSLIKKEIVNGELLQAASYGFDKLTKTQIGMFMARACRRGEAKPHEIHKAILNLRAKCFITTNYDRLIEMGINKWCPQESMLVVTNRQLSEMGKILQARAMNFIYKPHGDVEDAESIILTREQYRTLLINGERHMALETLKSLMVSRPVVYIGFGLRDPDFLYIRDILSNIYQGNIRDHYAIMADIEREEIDYWRRNYGIHLVGYETQIMPDGSKSHEPLLDLLKNLNDQLKENDKEELDNKAEIILALVRYASRLDRDTKVETEFGIRVHREINNKRIYYADKYDGSLVGDFLINSEENSILIGLPGAGKSYAMHRATNIIAQKLSEQCLKEDIDFQQMTIPVYIDLKLYDGNLEGMIEKEFSKTLPFERIINECRCKIFLDSYNEMPKEYWENGKYQQDFAKTFEKLKNSTIIIGTRTIDGLESYKFSNYYLDEIDKDDINSELEKRGMVVALNEIIYRIVSKPFYFQYIINGKIDIKNVTQPKHFYNEFFSGVQSEYNLRFSEDMRIQNVLSEVAYRALDCGIEAFPVEFIYEEICRENIFLQAKAKEDFINWLIYKGILVAHINGKVTFVHQSITEYLAANKLMKIYLVNKEIIAEKIQFYRWDQTVFFMVNLLPDNLVEEFISNLFTMDFGLVLRTIKYIEFQKEGVIDRVLKKIIENKEMRCHCENEIERSLKYDLPVSEENEEDIRKIIELGNIIGGAAVFCLWRIKGAAIKSDLMQFLLEHASDYNFCRNAVAHILSKLVEEEDLETLKSLMDKLDEEGSIVEQNRESVDGFVSALAFSMQKFSVSLIKEKFVENSELSQMSLIRKEILCDFLKEKCTSESLILATDLFMQGYKPAAITMYFITHFSESELPWEFFENKHIEKLIACRDDEVWTLQVLREILEHRKDLCELAEKRADRYNGISKASILFCIDSKNQERVFEALESLLSMEENEIQNQSYKLLEDIELIWEGKEDLFVKLIMKKNIELSSALMGGAAPPDVEGLGNLEIGDIDWWLMWIDELEKKKKEEGIQWFLWQLTGLLAKYTDEKVQKKILIRFNDEKCIYRKILLKYILPQTNTCIDDYNESAIEYIFNDLQVTPYWGEWRHHFFANIVDEKFVVKRILPLLSTSNGILKNNLVDIIRVAGREHGKRYLLSKNTETSLT